MRQPEITTVQYEPDSISKERLRTVAPARIRPSTGPTAPELRVEWRFHQGEPYYRIHYHDPNTVQVANVGPNAGIQLRLVGAE